MKNFDVVGLLISAFKLVGQQPLVDLLQTINVKSPKLYKLIIYGADYALSEAQVAATKTATKIDDEVVEALQGVLSASASANGLTL